MRRSRVHGTRWRHRLAGASDGRDMAACGEAGMAAGRQRGRRRVSGCPRQEVELVRARFSRTPEGWVISTGEFAA